VHSSRNTDHTLRYTISGDITKVTVLTAGRVQSDEALSNTLAIIPKRSKVTSLKWNRVSLAIGKRPARISAPIYFVAFLRQMLESQVTPRPLPYTPIYIH
jgi:hypothetical protein